MKLLRPGILALLLPAVALLPLGCEVDSSDTFSRDVATDFSGLYQGCGDNSAIVQQNGGNRITQLDLRQSGDSLEAVDNNGALWRGSLGEVQNGRSSFELRGRTTTGVDAWFSGTLSSSDSGSTNSIGSATGRMTGTYVEPDRYSTFCGSAIIPGTQTDTNTDTDTGTNTNTTNTVSSAP
ncbi:MAG: hypothetical protein H3C50_03845 [Kiritimatiellae bacterium]|nr:hypothetical protein [Kiritimatiellia bacterium]MCO5067758.1 hypothetical protein [Kiritimatiellia bacterium]